MILTKDLPMKIQFVSSTLASWGEKKMKKRQDQRFFVKLCLPKKITPWKINMDHNHGGLVQIIFLSKWVMAVGSSRSSSLFEEVVGGRHHAHHADARI